MAFDFPLNPNVNDKYTEVGTTWIWNGYAWDLQDTTEFLLNNKVDRSGDTMSAPLHLPPANPVHGYEAAHKNYVDQVAGGKILIADEPPPDAISGAQWWDSNSGKLYLFYSDADSDQWVQMNAISQGGQPGTAMADAGPSRQSVLEERIARLEERLAALGG
jgi:hypothetical protein